MPQDRNEPGTDATPESDADLAARSFYALDEDAGGVGEEVLGLLIEAACRGLGHKDLLRLWNGQQ
jgi:hypothetical protein